MISDEEIVGRLRAKLSGHDQRPVEFRPPSWQRWLDRSPVAMTTLNELGDNQPAAQISRNQLRELAATCTAGDSDSYLRLFTAVMIWGSGKTNGRGPRYLARALDAAPGSTLETTGALVQRGELAEAYRSFRIPGVGPSFATKWLWAIGTQRTSPPRPLILDTRVWRSLRTIGWNSIEAAGGNRRHAARYVAYVDAAHRWARACDSDPETIEWVLFRENGRGFRHF